MISISFEEFMRLVALRRQNAEQEDKATQDATREKVLRSDQQIQWLLPHSKQMATCPVCDAVVDVEILHPDSGLCPLCHEETQLRHR